MFIYPISTTPASAPADHSARPSYLHLATTVLSAPKKTRNAREILDFAERNLPTVGVLKQDERGFVYVDLPDSYIYDLYPMIQEAGVEIPPYFDFEGAYGAHISVILSAEALPTGALEEVGNTVSFTITDCQSVKPFGWAGIDKVYFLTVECPELEKLREKYGLSSKINGHEFHITIALKRTQETLGFDLDHLIADPAMVSFREKV